MASNQRQYLSGAQKRKKKALQMNEVKKLKPITSFFSSNEKESNDSDVGNSGTAVLSNTATLENEHSIQNKDKNEDNSELKITVNDVRKSISAVRLEISDVSKLNFPNYTSSDKGHFPQSILSTEEKKLVISLGSCRPKGPFPVDENTKSHFSEYYYQTTNKAGITIPRSWLCYSEILDCAYCEPCWLFADRNSPNFKSTWIDGIRAWRKLTEKINIHEISKVHLDACILYELWQSNSTIDKDFETEIQAEKSFWCKVLDRLLNVTIMLAVCNLSFRGHREQVGDFGNNGNFLSIVELLATYDPVLKDLIEKPAKSIRYLSHQIQDELIELLSNTVSKKIVENIKAAPFFSIIMDTTQDITKVDQLSKVIRYITIEKDENGIPKNLKVHESFLGFTKIEDASAEGLTDKIINSINDIGLDMAKCRGQGYDGAAVMSGCYSGVQKRILDTADRATYVHCASHNLNLVINDAVIGILEVSKFFDALEHIYTFFANSIKRWSQLCETYSQNKEKNLKLKRLCPTRWSSRNDSLLAIRLNYSKILLAVSKITLTSKNKSERDEATSIKKHMETFEFVFQVILHSKILTSINVVSKLLQTANTDICEAKILLDGALTSLETFRSDFDGAKNDALELAKTWNVKAQFIQKRVVKVKKHFDELCQDQRITDAENRFRINVFYGCLDIIITQLRNRFTSLNDIANTFKIIQPQELLNAKDSELIEMANLLVEKYQGDVTDQLASQLISLRSCLKSKIATIHSVKELADLLFIEHFRLSSSFPDVCTIVFLFLTIPVTVATAERSFSKLKLIKNYLRNTMCQERLSHLSILSIEHETTTSLRNNLDEIIKKFAEIKVRRVKL